MDALRANLPQKNQNVLIPRKGRNIQIGKTCTLLHIHVDEFLARPKVSRPVLVCENNQTGLLGSLSYFVMFCRFAHRRGILDKHS
ncbi:hypothetical protein NC653_011660 [Populus alba x Populus x berolinensis]|uniref:Uncharacterized protein n=1 Tax=Populus alba x Populus x berolinensis TaxID=444605 RepID=A0AAD6W778_9ROSI|nr:hypothetical protein NC653_011660 [Populus alba x Populus x berolinensis]